MGESLTLLPFREDDHFSHVVLPVDCDYEGGEELVEAIEALSERWGGPVPSEFNSHMSREGAIGVDHEWYGPTPTDSKGRPMRAVPAQALVGLINDLGVLNSIRNVAAWAYIRALVGGEMPRPFRPWMVALHW